VPNMQCLRMAHSLCQTYNQVHEVNLTVHGSRETVINLQASSDGFVVFCVTVACTITSLFRRFGLRGWGITASLQQCICVSRVI
jgi:hypothetical protein